MAFLITENLNGQDRKHDMGFFRYAINNFLQGISCQMSFSANVFVIPTATQKVVYCKFWQINDMLSASVFRKQSWLGKF